MCKISVPFEIANMDLSTYSPAKIREMFQKGHFGFFSASPQIFFAKYYVKMFLLWIFPKNKPPFKIWVISF